MFASIFCKMIDRYNRQIILENFGETSVDILRQKRVAVVGAGAVAASALPLLAGCGVGKIKICDGDCVCLSNLHRQSLFTERDVGVNKAKLATQRLRELNSEIEIECVEKNLATLDDAIAFVKDADLCLDMTDSIASRTLISSACAEVGVPEIMCAATEYISQIYFFDKTFKFSDIAPNGENETAKNFAIFPPSSHLSGIWGAGLAIKLLLNIEEFSAGYMQHFDFHSNTFSKLHLK